MSTKQKDKFIQWTYWQNIGLIMNGTINKTKLASFSCVHVSSDLNYCCDRDFEEYNKMNYDQLFWNKESNLKLIIN